MSLLQAWVEVDWLVGIYLRHTFSQGFSRENLTLQIKTKA